MIAFEDGLPIHGVPRQTNQLSNSLQLVDGGPNRTKSSFRFSVKIYTPERGNTR
ncbi:hypothetical protein SynA15127_02730 [Synechococcus sp. A15-127]|nr:hypothetical protein SynA15127_02730 [Synechococcus sp. A15-127]